MHIQDLILLVIGSENNKSLRGRTTLQKKLYFLSVLEETDLGFGPHYYIVNRQGRTTTEQIQEVAKEYDWDIDDSQIENVRSFLEDLSLISVGEPT